MTFFPRGGPGGGFGPRAQGGIRGGGFLDPIERFQQKTLLYLYEGIIKIFTDIYYLKSLVTSVFISGLFSSIIFM